MKLIPQTEDLEKRLDKFLTEKLEDKTRSQIKKMLKSGQVLINGKVAKVHQFLKSNDEIKIETETIAEKEKPLPTEEKMIEPKIIFEDENYLVIDKPVGLLVHPTDKQEKNTLVDYVVKKYPTVSEIGEQPNRSGIVHRLDKDVSGVMVVAKTKEAYASLKEQFKNRTIKKNYLAVCYGKANKEQGEILLPIGRNKEGQYVAHPFKDNEKFQDNDKFAKTHYKVLKYVKDYSVFDVEIFTGRSHQIRAHLSAVGHPILGDKIYKPKKKFFTFLHRRIKVLALPRIFLHSTRLGFKDLNDKFVEFKSPLPQEITNFLNEQKTK